MPDTGRRYSGHRGLVSSYSVPGETAEESRCSSIVDVSPGDNRGGGISTRCPARLGCRRSGQSVDSTPHGRRVPPLSPLNRGDGFRREQIRNSAVCPPVLTEPRDPLASDGRDQRATAKGHSLRLANSNRILRPLSEQFTLLLLNYCDETGNHPAVIRHS